MRPSYSNLRSACAVALLLGCACVHQQLSSKHVLTADEATHELERAQHLASFKHAMAAAVKSDPGELGPSPAEEWYTVAIAQV